jgi:putative ABC transport system substrate-binding protein
MRRREFISLIGAAAASWPLVARAQLPSPVIGFLSSRSPDDAAHLLRAFRSGLLETGYIEGQNVRVEYRWARGQYDQLPAMAAELTKIPVAVIAATGGEPSGLAAKAATSIIPIVFIVGDPIKLGLVASYNRPGGNATGVNALTPKLEAKRLGLLHELVPRAAMIGALVNPLYQPSDEQAKDLQEAALSLGLQIEILLASNDRDIDAAFESVAERKIATLLVAADPFFDTQRVKIVALAARHKLPTIYQFREYVVGDGLMSYGIDPADLYRQVGVYTGRILKGEKPGDLPVVQPTRFQLVINLKTAKSLGLTVPFGLLNAADDRSKQHLYSITSSARVSSECGTSRPSVFAVLRLITNSNLVGCSTGRSAGLAPLRIFPVYWPAWRYAAPMLVP